MSNEATKVPTTLDEIRATVQARYGATAARVAAGETKGAGCGSPADGSSGCCGSTSESWDPITSDLYEAGETAGLPAEALLASLGCGNPTALAELHEGEVVLDLGSGGGIDVLLSAKRVGPTGKAYGLDMTDEMLALALDNKAKAGATNVEFLKGHIESIPLPSNTVDVIISNCVINLSGDKRQVLTEAFRVLKPGGHFAVSDVITRDGLPQPVKESMALWTGCVAGALEENEFIALLKDVGFENPSIEPTRIYTRDDAAALIAGAGLDVSLADQVEGKIMSGFVRATKPGSSTQPSKPRRDLASIERSVSSPVATSTDLQSALQAALGEAYSVEHELGAGGMARVYLATERANQRRVAIKVLSPVIASCCDAERFRQEMAVAGWLDHPNIVPLLGKCDACGGEHPFHFVMPYVEGESLRARLDREGSLSARHVVQVLRDVASALAHAHAAGVVHRDIKPENVLLSHGRALVTDFGIAKALAASARLDPASAEGCARTCDARADLPIGLTVAGYMVGTPTYAAPEQALGDPETDHRADLYALGVIAYEMIAGRPPFTGPSPLALISAHLTAAPPPLSRTDVPAALEGLVSRLLEKQPERRPVSADEVLSTLAGM